jgi:hypothetical protein
MANAISRTTHELQSLHGSMILPLNGISLLAFCNIHNLGGGQSIPGTIMAHPDCPDCPESLPPAIDEDSQVLEKHKTCLHCAWITLDMTIYMNEYRTWARVSQLVPCKRLVIHPMFISILLGILYTFITGLTVYLLCCCHIIYTSHFTEVLVRLSFKCMIYSKIHYPE